MIRDDYYSRHLRRVVERDCKNGEHKLQKIVESGGDQESIVVRWCSACGAVVVDNDYDGRTNPGAVRKMVLPDIIQIFHTFPKF